MKIIWNNFDVVWIFCSFNDVFISSYSFKMFWELIGLLSSYHNTVDIVSIRTSGGFWDLSIFFDRRWRWWRLLRSTEPLLGMTRVLYMKVLRLQYRRSYDFHVISATYMRFGRSCGWAMPRSSKYRSRALRSWHAARGSQLVSPSVHLTLSSSSFEFSHQWDVISSTSHSCLSSWLKS